MPVELAKNPSDYDYLVSIVSGKYKVIDKNGKMLYAKADLITALDAIKSHGTSDYVIKLAAGTYTWGTGDHDFPSDSHFIGSGVGNTIIDFGTGADEQLKILDVDNVYMSDFSFTGQGRVIIKGESSGAGCNHIILERIRAYSVRMASWGGTIGVLAYDGDMTDIRFTDCSVYQSDMMGFVLYRSAGTPTFKDIYFTRCHAEECGKAATRYNDWACGIDVAEGNADMTVENIYVTNCSAKRNWESGFHMEGMPVKRNIVIQGCISEDNGIDKGAPTYGRGFGAADDTILMGCIARGNALVGIGVNDNAKCIGNIVFGESVTARGIVKVGQNGQIMDNSIYDVTGNGIDLTSADHFICANNRIVGVGGDGIDMGNCDYSIITGNWVELSTAHGINCTGDYNTISNNFCLNNSVTGVGYGIHLGSATYNSIVGNMCIDNGPGTQNNGIKEVAPGNHNEIIGNTCMGNTVSQISTVGAQTDVNHNMVA